MEKLFKDLKEFCKSKGLEEREAAYLLGLFMKHEPALRQPPVMGSVCDHNAIENGQWYECSKCGQIL